MSIWKEIRCDRNGPRCYDHANNNFTGFDTATDLRRQAKRGGWRHIDGDDICPACLKEPTR